MIRKDAESEYVEITKSALKKLQKTLDGIRRKEAKAASIASSAATAKEEVEPLIVEDKSLPKAEKIKIRQAAGKREKRVVVRGWVASVRAQSRKLVFVDLRDGSDLYLQCVFTGTLVISPHSIVFTVRRKVEQFKNSLSKPPSPSMELFLLYSLLYFFN